MGQGSSSLQLRPAERRSSASQVNGTRIGLPAFSICAWRDTTASRTTAARIALPGSQSRAQRHGADALPGSVENRVRNRGRDADNRCFTRAERLLVFAVDEHDFDLRHIAEPRHSVLRQMRIQDAVVFELDGFEQSSANALNDRTCNEVLEMLGINHG